MQEYMMLVGLIVCLSLYYLISKIVSFSKQLYAFKWLIIIIPYEEL